MVYFLIFKDGNKTLSYLAVSALSSIISYFQTEQMPGNRNQPQELSFYSFEPQTREGNGVCEEKSNSDTLPRQQRSQGEQLISGSESLNKLCSVTSPLANTHGMRRL